MKIHGEKIRSSCGFRGSLVARGFWARFDFVWASARCRNIDRFFVVQPAHLRKPRILEMSWIGFFAVSSATSSAPSPIRGTGRSRPSSLWWTRGCGRLGSW